MIARPILFSAPMVRALRDGSKTQTRLVVKLPHQNPLGTWEALPWGGPNGGMLRDGSTVPAQMVIGHSRTGDIIGCPYGQPGDWLRVKEGAWMWCERRPNGKTKTGRDKWLYVPMREAPIHYAADHPKMPMLDVVSPDTGNKWGWRFKIGRFLPAWASRITPEIVSVRIERLQDISEADALAEGVDEWARGACGDPDALTPVGKFELLWSEINGRESWDASPWVWCVEFRRLP